MAMYLKNIAIFCLATIPVSLCYDDIDVFMTGDQKRQVFGAEADSVPTHELIEINLSERNKRDLLPPGTRFTMQVFGEKIPLWIKSAENILFGNETPVYSAFGNSDMPGEVLFMPDNYTLPKAVRLLENDKFLASLVILMEDSGRPRINGHIGKRGLVVKSLSHDVVTKYFRNRRSIDNVDVSNTTCYAVVYKTNKDFGQNYTIADIDQKMLQERNTRSTERIPEVLYLELLVYVEYSTLKEHEFNQEALLEYLMIFWNGVDLKYRAFKTPKVRLHISAIVIGIEPSATPYISKYMVDDKSFLRSATLEASTKFFYAIRESFPLKSYDVAVTITKLRMKDENSTNSRTVGGFAGVNGACLIYPQWSVKLGVAFVRDFGGSYYGVHVAAHELGHSLGIHHDDETKDCLFEHGHIMASRRGHTTNSSEFSACSIREFQETLDKGWLRCLYNEPKSFGKDIEILMPGELKNLTAQCLDRAFREACDVETVDICVNYRCISEWGYCINSYAGAFDGTPCETGSGRPPKICLKNKCVHFQRPVE